MKKLISICVSVCMGISYVWATPSSLIPIGQTAGIKVMCDGVIITGITSVSTSEGTLYPAKTAGLAVGDIIKEINGIIVYTNEEAYELISNSDIVHITYERDNEIKTTTINSALDINDGESKIGIWVRDSLAGIGTITFIDPETYEYTALGHSISDSDSGTLLPIKNGELVSSSISDVLKSESGNPGALFGDFDLSDEFGTITDNTEEGIHGVITDFSKFQHLSALEIASFDEITAGSAHILSNVNGTDICKYDIEIIDISENNQKNFVIQVVDEKLLEITGGIVQGMSGSPIIQENKIVGAVTHVFINDPTKGYGIFIENMLETAEETRNIA